MKKPMGTIVMSLCMTSLFLFTTIFLYSRLTDERFENAIEPLFFTEEAINDFVSSWAISKKVAAKITYRFTRNGDNGQTYKNQTIVSQDRTRYISFSSTHGEAYIGGKRHLCSFLEKQNHFECKEDGNMSYEAYLVKEMDLIKRYVQGSEKTYSVAYKNIAVTKKANENYKREKCFSLVQNNVGQVVEWGKQATFCFDKSNGLLKSAEYRRETATDLIEAQEVVPVQENDFRLPITR